MKRIALVVATVGATLAFVIVPAALAKDGDIIKTGPCSAASDWKLKLSPENGQIEVEFEVDQNKRGERWSVQIFHNGEKALDRNFRTRGRSGSFEARIVEPNRAGVDQFSADAKNLRTGETCHGEASGF